MINMFLYYQTLVADYEPEFIGEYDTIEELMEKIKQEFDEGHEACPDAIPTFNEFVNKDFSNYDDDNDYIFYKPSEDEINALNKNEFIKVIYEYVDGIEEAYIVSKYKI